MLRLSSLGLPGEAADPFAAGLHGFDGRERAAIIAWYRADGDEHLARVADALDEHYPGVLTLDMVVNASLYVLHVRLLDEFGCTPSPGAVSSGHANPPRTR